MLIEKKHIVNLLLNLMMKKSLLIVPKTTKPTPVKNNIKLEKKKNFKDP